MNRGPSCWSQVLLSILMRSKFCWASSSFFTFRYRCSNLFQAELVSRRRSGETRRGEPLEVKLTLLLLLLAARLDTLLKGNKLLLLLMLKFRLALEHLLLLLVLPLLQFPGLQGVTFQLNFVCLRVTGVGRQTTVW